MSKKDYLSTQHLSTDLKKRSIDSTKFTVLAQIVKIIVEVVSIVVLSRILAPTDFGVIAMATIFVGFSLILVEGGFSIATIHKEHISLAQVSNLFWINVFLGTILYFLVVLLAPLLSQLYKEDLLVNIFYILGFQFVLESVSVQHDALLRRRMEFRAIAVLETVARLAGISVAIVCALMGMGFWSLVVMSLVMAFVKTILRWFYTKWVPDFYRNCGGMLELIQFGASVTGSKFIGYVIINIPTFLIGYSAGSQTLGLYNRATTLITVPTSQLLPPVLRVFQSAVARVASDSERLRRAIIDVMTKLFIVTTCVSIFIFTLADWIVFCVMGPGWEQAVFYVQALSLFTVVTPITTFMAITLVAVGHANALLRLKLISFFIVLASSTFGMIWGAKGIVLSNGLAGFLIVTPLFLTYTTKYLPILWSDFQYIILPALGFAFITAIFITAMKSILHFDNVVLGLLVMCAMCTLCYVALCVLNMNFRRNIFEMFVIITKTIRHRRVRSD